MTISFPSNTKDIIDQIRIAIGREVLFQTVTQSGCIASGCGVDPITHTAINPFCSVCSGVGYTTTLSGLGVLAHISWKPSGLLNWIVAGQYYTGDCLLQVEYTPTNRSLVEDAKYVVVDDKRLRVETKTPRGVPSLNRILLECRLEEE